MPPQRVAKAQSKSQFTVYVMYLFCLGSHSFSLRWHRNPLSIFGGMALPNSGVSISRRPVLDAHNDFRARHGVPPLFWCDDCAQSAAKAAAECQRAKVMKHCFTEGEKGRHGQNIYWRSVAIRDVDKGIQDAVRVWYDEIALYQFDRPTFSAATGHFTQVVWRATTHVGMAPSADGTYLIANYRPCGNCLGMFVENVPRPAVSGNLTAAASAVHLPAAKSLNNNSARPSRVETRRPENVSRPTAALRVPPQVPPRPHPAPSQPPPPALLPWVVCCCLRPPRRR